MLSILDRYIARSIIVSTLLVFIVLISLFLFIKFVDVLGDTGKANFGLYEAVRYVLLTIPRQVYELFPIAALLGTTLGLSSLAVDSELVAIRAAGISLLRIVGAVSKLGLVFILLALAIGELLAPVAEDVAERGRSAALQQSVKQQSDYGLWMRDGRSFVHVGEVLPDLSLLRVSIYQFDEQDNLRSQTFAQSGQYDVDHWRLANVSHSLISEKRVETRRAKVETWQSTLVPDTLAVFAVRPEGLSVWHLYRYIQHLKQNKQDTARYTLAFWNKVVAPFATGVMMILAVPFVFTQMRSTGVGARMLMGVMLGLGFFVLNRGFGYVGLLYGLPPIIGVLLPILVFLGLAVWMLRRVG